MEKNNDAGTKVLWYRKIFNIMRNTFILLILITSNLLASTGYSQNAKFDISLKNKTLEEVFGEIEKKSEFSIVYKSDEVNLKEHVSVNVRQQTVDNILNNVLKNQGLTYTINDRHIIIHKPETNMSGVSQQSLKKVTGTVKDMEGEPIIGANVVEKGTTNGIITDLNGQFTINMKETSILEISYIGYATQEYNVQGQSVFNVVMREDTKLLDEVVVVGYGTQRKVNLTGSIGTIKTEDALIARPVTNVQELLAGTIPGLAVSKASGAVGSGADMNIRGTSTIGGSSGVLVLIDGIPGNIYTLNPNDIESISVLKDAASASIYGSRAANGVILITTKMAKESLRPVVEVSSHVGVQNPQFMLDFVGASDFMRLYDIAMQNDSKEAYYGEQGQSDLRAGKYPDNKWYKEIFKKNTLINNTHIALSGKEKSITYRLSVSNDYQDGTLPNNEYNRFIIKPDLQFQLLKNLKARLNMQYTQTNIQNPNGGTTHWQSQSSRISPVISIKEKNGLYGIGDREGNPIAGVNESGYNKERHKEMLAIFDVIYSPLKDWNIKGTVASYSHNNTKKDRSKTYYLYDADGNVARTENLIPTLRETNEYLYRTQIQFLTDYKFSLNETHNFSLLAGYSQEYYNTENFWASRDNMPFDNIDVLDTGSSNLQNGGNAQDVAIQSVFGRINYDYMGKYLFEASLRTDGSSRFADGHRWGVFPSFSAGWNVQRESFMQEIEWLSELKIRASWGTLGDAEKVGYYPTAQVLTYNPKIYAFNNALVGGAYSATAINRDITWERSEQKNIGLDLGFLDQRIKFTAEYFINNRKDILYTPPVPTEFGLAAPISNLLEMKNTGMEFLFSYNDKKGDFSWGIDLNAGFSKNKVLEMGSSDRWIENNVITYLNDRYQLPYGYEADGLFQSEEDIKNHATQGNVLPGNIKFKDQNEDGKIDGDDRVVLSRKIPVNYGSNIYLGYKGFDFLINMYGRINTERYISGYEGWAFYLTQNARPMHIDSWSETNKNASYPRLTLTNTSNDTQYNSFWLRNADYLKIQNIQIGYVIPKAILGKVNIDYLRIYLSSQNIATITGYDGFDPEGGWYPLPRTFAFGFNLKF